MLLRNISEIGLPTPWCNGKIIHSKMIDIHKWIENPVLQDAEYRLAIGVLHIGANVISQPNRRDTNVFKSVSGGFP